MWPVKGCNWCGGNTQNCFMGLAYTFSKTMKFISGELMMFSTCKLHLQCPSNIYASFKAGRRIDFTSKNYIKRWKLSRASVFQTWIWWNTITLPISDLLTLFGKSCPAKSIPKFEWRILGKEILWIRILVWKKLSSGISNVCHQQNYYVWLGLLFWINSTSLSMCYCPSLCHKIINVLM